MSDLNILNYLDFGDGCRRYELNDASPNEHQHHHLICVECGKVLEFTDDLLGNLEEKNRRYMQIQNCRPSVKILWLL
mgnify:FL=1